jgi:adenylate kinase family enzyme
LKTQKTLFIVLIGATCVGKGFLVKLFLCMLSVLMGRGLRVEAISFGQIIRDKIKDDLVFASEYGQGVGKGKLLDDDKAIELFEGAYKALCAKSDPDIVFIDGFCRSTRQIEWASQHGFLKTSDIVIFLTARVQVCLDRFLHRKSKDDQKRIDAEVKTFYDRFELHEGTAPDLRAMLMDTGPQVIDIDAERDIAEHVAPATFAKILPSILETVQSKTPRQATAT